MNDQELREVLIEAFQQVKEQRNAIASLLAEVGAIRDSLLEIGPKYRGILARHRKNHIRESKPLVVSDLRRLDEIIQRLRDG